MFFFLPPFEPEGSSSLIKHRKKEGSRQIFVLKKAKVNPLKESSLAETYRLKETNRLKPDMPN